MIVVIFITYQIGLFNLPQKCWTWVPHGYHSERSICTPCTKTGHFIRTRITSSNNTQVGKCSPYILKSSMRFWVYVELSRNWNEKSVMTVMTRISVLPIRPFKYFCYHLCEILWACSRAQGGSWKTLFNVFWYGLSNKPDVKGDISLHSWSFGLPRYLSHIVQHTGMANNPTWAWCKYICGVKIQDILYISAAVTSLFELWSLNEFIFLHILSNFRQIIPKKNNFEPIFYERRKWESYRHQSKFKTVYLWKKL